MKKVSGKLGIAASVFAASMLLCVAPADAKTINAKSIKKLTKKTISVTVGKTVNLKSKVKVKPAKAKLKWSTSKKSIATVTSKGVVKGKKAGTAKITVKSGKKSAKFTVKVKKAPVKVGVSKVEVLSSKTVRVTLNKAQKVAASKFSVYKKVDSNGSAKKKLNIASVGNSGNKVYTILLSDVYGNDESDINYIGNGDYAQVTVSGLAGTKTKSAKYVFTTTPKEQYETGLVNRKVDTTVYFGEYTTGYSSFTVGTLPAGLSATQHGTYVEITGIPTTVCNNFTTKITAKDEKNKTVERTVHFFYGSETQMVGYALPRLAPAGKTVFNYALTVVGGDGTKKYSTALQNPLISLDTEDGDVRVDETAPAGVYDVPVTVADNSGHSVAINVQTKIVPSVLITGTVRNAKGTVVENAEVSASFTTYDKEYANSSTNFYAYTDETGVYKLYVPASKTYDFEAYRNGAYKYVNNVTVAASGTVPADFTLDKLFEIKTNLTNLGSIEWTDAYTGDSKYSKNGVFNLKAGVYKLTSEEVYVTKKDAQNNDVRVKEVYTLELNVTTNAEVTVTVKSSDVVTSESSDNN